MGSASRWAMIARKTPAVSLVRNMNAVGGVEMSDMAEATTTQSPIASNDPVPVRIDSAAHAEAEVDMDLLEATLDYIRPAIQMDGGDIVLQGVEEGVVTLQMVGACGGCPLSMMTLKSGIERILKDRVPGVNAVDAVA